MSRSSNEGRGGGQYTCMYVAASMCLLLLASHHHLFPFLSRPLSLCVDNSDLCVIMTTLDKRNSNVCPSR